MRYSQGDQHCREHLWVQEHQRYPGGQHRAIKTGPVPAPGPPAAQGREGDTHNGAGGASGASGAWGTCVAFSTSITGFAFSTRLAISTLGKEGGR